MPDEPPRDDADPGSHAGRPAAAPLWRSRRLWHTIGYIATGLWIVGVLFVTRGDSRHPLFDTIFLVPLGFWVAGLIAAALVTRALARRDGA